jgi:hypothetical protein
MMTFDIEPGNAIAVTGVVTGLVIAGLQFWFGTRHERFANTLLIIDHLEDRDMLSIRHRVDDIMDAAKAHAYDFNKLSDEDRAALSSVAKLFGLVGVLARRNSIDRSIVYPGWARNICATCERLEPYFAWRESLPGGRALNGDFRWLARKVRRYFR